MEDELGKVAYMNQGAIDSAWTNQTKEMLNQIADQVEAVAAIVIYQTPDGIVTVRGQGITRGNCAQIAAAMQESATNVAGVKDAERRLPHGVSEA